MGVFCQGDEENKKLATENRTGKRPPPRRGLHRLCGTLLTCGAQRGWGAHPHAWRREGPLSQDPCSPRKQARPGQSAQEGLMLVSKPSKVAVQPTVGIACHRQRQRSTA